MKKTILFLSIIFASGLFMVTVYNTMIDAKSWSAEIPSSVQVARNYYKHVDPRNFFAVIAPINQLLVLSTLILFWKDSVLLRIYFGISFLLYATIGVLTSTYFIPRDLIIFTWPIENHVEQIKTALSQWGYMNWLRSLIGLAGVICSLKGLDIFYRISKSGNNIVDAFKTNLTEKTC